MTVWQSLKTDPIRAHWLGLLLLVDFSFGTIQMFGNPAQVLCGTLLLGATVLIGLGWSKTGAALGVCAWTVSLMAALDVPAASILFYGYPILLGGSVGWHILVLYDVGTGLDEARELKQRS
jgi:hypothetical protein